jgi:hypothetical protein
MLNGFILNFTGITTLDVFSNPNKKVEISTPYDPVHLTHVGFNSDTGEFTVSTTILALEVLEINPASRILTLSPLA